MRQLGRYVICLIVSRLELRRIFFVGNARANGKMVYMLLVE